MKKVSSLILKIGLILLFGISQAYAAIYYRGDARTPDEIRREGGLYPRNYTNGVPNPGITLNMSLFEYASTVFISTISTPYVSTTDTAEIALRFAGVLGGYVYFIQGDDNLIDLNSALGSYSPSRHEREHSALNGIPWHQIRGWRSVDSHGRYSSAFVSNPDYAGDGSFSGESLFGSAAQRLAGFPAGHEAWGRSPWSYFVPSGCGASNTRAATTTTDTSTPTLTSTTPTQCELSERKIAWEYYSGYRDKKTTTKKVIQRSTKDSRLDAWPTGNKQWVDMDNTGFLSLCGLYTTNGATRITCARNNGDNATFVSVDGAVSDYGWGEGRAFTPQVDLRIAYCRVINFTTKLTCANYYNGNYFSYEVTTSEVDAGYGNTRSWQDIYPGEKSAYCRLTGNSLTYYRVYCQQLYGARKLASVFEVPDYGDISTWMWLDIQGKGPGYSSLCRFIGGSRLACVLRTGDDTWSSEITTGSVDKGYSGYRFPVRMNGPAQEYCRVTGGYYEYLTCTSLTSDKTLKNYAVALPRRINSGTLYNVQFADVDGDSRDDLCFADQAAKNLYCYLNAGGRFQNQAVTLPLTFKPWGDFNSLDLKIQPIVYTPEGPISTVCYKSDSKSITCDKFLVY